MTVLAIGTLVDVGGGTAPIQGKIAAIFIRGETDVRYEVTWMDGRTLHREVMNLEEFDVHDGAVRLTIGFKSPP